MGNAKIENNSLKSAIFITFLKKTNAVVFRNLSVYKEQIQWFSYKIKTKAN